eukprot:TRINITY_DN15822_c0_g1_i1.p1 TRINITY_DN15822_c0_g1~~TRINITY_DN15822_c0_g1_i1.p1  ORF type:complete len:114 (+),score=4.83 TRINITY_DN15822_c0_g1_i1:433-774(+)
MAFGRLWQTSLKRLSLCLKPSYIAYLSRMRVYRWGHTNNETNSEYYHSKRLGIIPQETPTHQWGQNIKMKALIMCDYARWMTQPLFCVIIRDFSPSKGSHNGYSSSKETSGPC